ncbi:EAL domain-containing protein [Alteraurantiacibacter buctensis]|uniref:EAL domain-containing protein n=1 Tax=Alteraurantiacibacter buctensis TaxID=1503981 RepID=A0A844Z2R1_9SPHN|nr:EAL domain-containing protein [Alteraurantiacibacter buctensis]MXO73430.1 EAL domain-containing protein [Alteraurantiacibacter buctensis]
MPEGKERMGATERISHATWAGLVALVLSISTVLLPLDEMTWMLQSRIANFPVSGDIVYIGSVDDLTDPDEPERRVELAEALDSLRQTGVDQVYVDLAFSRPSRALADQRLNQALLAFNGRAFLVRTATDDASGRPAFLENVPAVGIGIPQVSTYRWRNFMGYTWELRETNRALEEQLPSLHVALAGRSTGRERNQIFYGFDRSSIPTYRLENITHGTGPLGARTIPVEELRGKKVVIGYFERSDGQVFKIPGHQGVPATFIDIYGAETLKAGFTRSVSSWTGALVMLLGLILLVRVPRRRVRYAGYALLALALPVATLVGAQTAVPVSLSGALVLLGMFSILRLRSLWQQTLRLIDPETRLPTFAAMETASDLVDGSQAIIVARIHRFEEVRRTLPKELHAEYMLRLIARLKAAKRDAVIYAGPGHLIAWTFPEKEPALVREHLEGLRALFSSPLLVGDNQVDVRITFGVDITPSPNVARRLAAAIDAAERTTETYEPIVIAESTSDEDLIWNISLQARIDAALANGEIYMIYQPKVLVQTGEIVGVESLVRWRDPVKGLIPPDSFIRQCENAGRMGHLTRHALTEACQAGNRFAEAGLHIPVAVNISSTLVHEPQIVAMVSEVLHGTGFDPRRLTLEITETYRISDFDRAAEVLGDLAALGPKISMDDFGVGAASLEALQRLPFGELKIDRLFIAAMKDDAKAYAIVRNVLQMGKDLRIIVVAEGVENAATLTKLRDAGCLVAQGFGISRPVPFDEILQFQKLRPEDRLTKMV